MFDKWRNSSTSTWRDQICTLHLATLFSSRYVENTAMAGIPQTVTQLPHMHSFHFTHTHTHTSTCYKPQHTSTYTSTTFWPRSVFWFHYQITKTNQRVNKSIPFVKFIKWKWYIIYKYCTWRYHSLHEQTKSFEWELQRNNSETKSSSFQEKGPFKTKTNSEF